MFMETGMEVEMSPWWAALGAGVESQRAVCVGWRVWVQAQVGQSLARNSQQAHFLPLGNNGDAGRAQTECCCRITAAGTGGGCFNRECSEPQTGCQGHPVTPRPRLQVTSMHAEH